MKHSFLVVPAHLAPRAKELVKASDEMSKALKAYVDSLIAQHGETAILADLCFRQSEVARALVEVLSVDADMANSLSMPFAELATKFKDARGLDKERIASLVEQIRARSQELTADLEKQFGLNNGTPPGFSAEES